MKMPLNLGNDGARLVIQDSEAHDLFTMSPFMAEEAAAIVRAVNANDALVVAARSALGELEHLASDAGNCDHSVGVCYYGLRRALEHCKGALDAAGQQIGTPADLVPTVGGWWWFCDSESMFSPQPVSVFNSERGLAFLHPMPARREGRELPAEQLCEDWRYCFHGRCVFLPIAFQC